LTNIRGNPLKILCLLYVESDHSNVEYYEVSVVFYRNSTELYELFVKATAVCLSTIPL
jgi:hypothetical protein